MCFAASHTAQQLLLKQHAATTKTAQISRSRRLLLAVYCCLRLYVYDSRDYRLAWCCWQFTCGTGWFSSSCNKM